MKELILSFIVCFVAVAWPPWTWVDTTPPLPQVDLGYEIHEALFYNKTTKRFIFHNIRYAQAPIGGLRFAPPVAPTGVNPVVQRGNESRICPRNMLGDLSDLEKSLQIPGTTEDCLFLDVVVPREAFDGRGSCPTKVFLHFHMFDDEEGRTFDMQHYIEHDSIYVSANYRLGSQGTLAPSLSEELHNESADLGKLDQDLALKWVEQNIHQFASNHGQIYTIKSSWTNKKDDN